MHLLHNLPGLVLKGLHIRKFKCSVGWFKLACTTYVQISDILTLCHWHFIRVNMHMCGGEGGFEVGEEHFWFLPGFRHEARHLACIILINGFSNLRKIISLSIP